MPKVYDIARSEGFQIIYSDTGNVFVKKDGADREYFEEPACRIRKATKLPIKVDRIHRFPVLLPSKNKKLTKS